MKENGHPQLLRSGIDRKKGFIIIIFHRGNSFKSGKSFFFQTSHFACPFGQINKSERDIHSRIALGTHQNFFLVGKGNIV